MVRDEGIARLRLRTRLRLLSPEVLEVGGQHGGGLAHRPLDRMQQLQAHVQGGALALDLRQTNT